MAMTAFVSHHPFRACCLCLFRVGCGSKPPGVTRPLTPNAQTDGNSHRCISASWNGGRTVASCPTTAASRMQRLREGRGDKARRRRERGPVSDSANLLAQLERYDTIGLHVWPDVPFRFPSRPRKIFSNLCLCCLPMPVARRRQPHLRRAAACFPEKAAPIPAAGPPSLETPPSVTRRRPTGGMPVKPRPECLLESSVSPCQQSLGFGFDGDGRAASCPSASSSGRQADSVEVTRDSTCADSARAGHPV